MANVYKSKMMTCQPGTIRSGMSKEAVGWQTTGKRATYQESLLSCLSCPDYRVELTAGSMMAQYMRLNRTEIEIDWDRYQSFRWITSPTCLKSDYPGSRLSDSSRPRVPWIVSYMECRKKTIQLEVLEGQSTYPLGTPFYFPHCELCGRQVPPWFLNNRKYTTYYF